MKKTNPIFSRHLFGVIILLIFTSLNLSCNKLDLNNKSGYVISDDFAKIDNSVIKINTKESSNKWNNCFKTKNGLFKPGKQYKVKINCETKEAVKDGYLFLLVRPFEKNNGSYDDIASRIVLDLEGPTEVILQFIVPADRSDYAFQIHTHGKVIAEIASISIEEAPEKIYIPAMQGKNLQLDNKQIPQGATEFSVDLPELKPDAVISVADFGASEKSEDNTKAFQKAIDVCHGKKGIKLIVPKGTYHFSSKGRHCC